MADCQKRRLVQITILERTIDVHTGTYAVRDLKKLAGVPEGDNLEELVKGRIKPLDDNGKTHIEGGEVFVVCGTGAAS